MNIVRVGAKIFQDRGGGGLIGISLTDYIFWSKIERGW